MTKSTPPRVFLWIAGLAVAALCTAPASADLVKKGCADIPGSGGKQVSWRAGYRKTPGDSAKARRSVHFWYELELKNAMPDDDVSFIVCAMINIKRKKNGQPAFEVVKNAGTYECQAAGTEDFFVNYHFGCKTIRLHPGNNHKDSISFDETVELSQEFTEADLVAPYLDFIADCPIDPNCNVIPGQNKFLTPLPDNGGINPDNTRSWWIVTKDHKAPTGPIIPGTAEGEWMEGNWYTMALPNNQYDSRLQGILRNAPAGSTVRVTLPQAAILIGNNTFVVGGAGCLGQDTFIQVDYTFLGLDMANDPDPHTKFEVSYPDTACADYPDDQVIEFTGEVVALGFSTMPDGSTLYAPGDFMHGIHAQFLAERDVPFVVQQSAVSAGGGLHRITCQAGDSSTMTIAAALEYSLDGAPQDDLPMPFGDPAAVGEDTRFEVLLGPLADGTVVDYRFLLVDDAMNEATSKFFSYTATDCDTPVYCDTNPANLADIGIDTCDCSAGSILVTMSGGRTNQFGYLLIGAANGTVTDPPGAQGDLCLIGAQIGRYTSDAGVTDGSGNLSTDILNALSGGGGGNIPNPPGGNVCFPPGQTWNFQYWHRDGMNPSKFSKAISATFVN